MRGLAMTLALSMAALAACSGEQPVPSDDMAASAAASDDAGMAAAAPASGAGPTFDCTKTESDIEDMVCKSAEFSAMDRELARLYGLAEKTSGMDPARLNELKATQRGWIKGRNECWKASDKQQCVMTSYAMRIHELRQGYANARSADGAGKSMGPVALACKGLDFGISATFVQTDPGAVYLEWKDSSLALAHVQSGSGAKYEGKWDDKTATLFTQGEEAMLTLPGEPERSCAIEEIG